jgi:sugar diacid utilization regulator
MPSDAFGAAVQPVGIVLIPDPDGPGRRAQIESGLRDRRAVLGPTVDWLEARVSIQRATLAWPLHAAGDLTSDPLAVTDDHTTALLLASAPRIASDLATRRLAPLDEMTPAARERSIETLRAWLDTHGDVSAAAERLHVHPQTVRYRLNGLREALGDDALDDPARRLELQLALQATAASRAAGASNTDAGTSGAASPPPGNA